MNIYITKEAYNKMSQYILATDLEISGLGAVHIDKEGDIIINDIKIFEQEVTGASTEIDLEKIAKFLIEEEDKGEDISKYRVWWHSHNTMNAYFSGTDTNTIKEFGKTFDWLISIVGNHDLDYKTRLDIFKPYELNERVKDLEKALDIKPETIEKEATLLILEDIIEVTNEIQKEVDEKVKKYTPPATSRKENIYNYGKAGAADRCKANGGHPIYHNGKYSYCNYPTDADIENIDQLELEYIESQFENKEILTKKEEHLAENRTRYYVKNPLQYDKDVNMGKSLCGGYDNCETLTMCEVCYRIDELFHENKNGHVH